MSRSMANSRSIDRSVAPLRAPPARSAQVFCWSRPCGHGLARRHTRRRVVWRATYPELDIRAHYLESDFIWSDHRARQHSPATTAGGTRDKFDRRGGTPRCPREGRCSFPSEHCRTSRRTSGTTDGATRDCPFAPCTRRVAVRLLVTAVMPGRRLAGCGSPGGTAPRAVERSVCCRTFLPQGGLAYWPRSNTVSPLHCRPRAWRPPPTCSADLRSLCPAPCAGCGGALKRSKRPSRM